FTLAIGEFGGKYGHDGEEKDKAWQDALVDYFIDKKIYNFFYWSWNPNSGDTGGLLQDDWTTIWQDKYDNLKRLMDVCDAAIPGMCTYSINPVSKDFPASGDIQTITITVSAETCAWTVSEDMDWITVSGTGSTGSGNVTVSASPNTGASRSGTVIIAGQSFSVSQEAVIKGDINGDGVICLADAILALQVVAGYPQTGLNLAADVDDDGKIGMAEVIYVLQQVAGF
ncbi:MAG: BACON domain-containing carbohydrate-binding protein, partial [Desulfatirhabdiaceae bacterium]